MKLRIAPSPTGQLHIGNARTALFNWLYAKANNGTFLVRIDDTDTERSTKEFQKDITENLKWLGLHWDEGIEVGGSHDSYKQSSRFDRYQEVAENLLSRNLAYEDDGAIRFKVPNDGSIEFKDYIRGDMLFNLSDVEDFVILRSDKSPTYHLASTVDDIDYGITIIARGEDILSSTPKHIMLMKAMDASLPDFCHLPLLFGPDGKKLSKRLGDTSVEAFKNKGILSEAMFNYLCLLGWSPGNDLEQFDINTAISKFDLKNVLPNSAIFDEKKLLWLNGLYIRSADIEDFQSTALSQIENDIQRSLFDDEKSRLLKIFPSVQERIETLADLTQQVMFLIDEPFVVDELDWQDVNNEEAQKYLFLLREEFINLDNFSLDSIEIIMRKTLEEIISVYIAMLLASAIILSTSIGYEFPEGVLASTYKYRSAI